MISMIDIINPYVIKIIIAARERDSINAIAQRTGISFGWAHKWVTELAKIGVAIPKRMEVTFNTKHPFYRNTMQYIHAVFRQDPEFYYTVLSYMGIRYCFIKTDAVFVWTKGGYNIGRSKEYYPIFIKILQKDRAMFQSSVKKLGLQINKKRGIFYHPEFVGQFPIEYCEGVPVEPLQITIDFMREYIYNFEPALEMIQEMYHIPMKIAYKEVITNQ